MGSAGQNGCHDTALTIGPGIVLGRSGASFGQAHFCEADFWPHNTALYVTDFHGNNSRFVFYFLRSLNFSRHNSGGAQQSLNRNFIAPIPVAVPPLLEQEAIAEALSDANALIESLEQLIAKKRQIKQGTMQELLTGKKRLPGFATEPGYKQTEVGVIPEGWGLRPLGEVVTFLDGKRRPVKDADRAKMHGSIPYYGASGIVDYVNDYLFDEDLILLAEDGENILSRNCCLAFRISGKAWVNNHAHVLRPNPDVSIGFLTDYLESLNYERFNSGTAQPKLNKQACIGIPIALPPALAEQEAIAAILTDMDAEIAALEAKLVKTRQLKQGMMKELLTGKIRLVESAK
jgi:type I restriction enzyme, S subunit